MGITATQAKNHLGKVLELAQREPVVIEKAGRRHSVVISHERYQQLLASEAGESLTARKKQFTAKYKAWIDAQNQHFDKNGLWSDELRVW